VLPWAAGKVAEGRTLRPVTGLLERVFVIGGEGQLGREVCEAFGDATPVAPPHAELDLEDAAALERSIGEHRPTLVVNTAAYHNVERCEDFPDRADAVNAVALGRLAELCARAGAALATISTDYVFDGTAAQPYREDAPTNPLSAYGRSKLRGEQLVRAAGDGHFIIRTSGLYGRYPCRVKGYTFVDLMLSRAERGEDIRAVDDIVFSPSYAPHVARALRGLVERSAFGTYHVSNSGQASWYDVTAAAFELAGIRKPPARVPASEFPTKVDRPKYSVFAHEGIARAGLPPMPHWRTGLEEYVLTRP
jgi:dTDP-4-dehydrorhamnose reductase